jgi:hypothetical protein
MSFSEQLATDMANVFLNEDELAEPVIYVKKDGSQRPISAQVFRDPVEIGLGAGRPKMRLIVANHATLGISSVELDTGGDQIEVAYRIGETPRRFNIRRSPINAEDAGALELEL